MLMQIQYEVKLKDSWLILEYTVPGEAMCIYAETD